MGYETCFYYGGDLNDVKDSVNLTTLFPQYEIKKIYRINLNAQNKQESGLVKDYYLFSKISK